MPRQEAKPPGKTSKLSQDRMDRRQNILFWNNSDVFPGGFASCLGITLIDVALEWDLRDIDGATHFIQYKFVQFHRIYKQT